MRFDDNRIRPSASTNALPAYWLTFSLRIGTKLLIIAVIKGNESIVRLLLEHGADVNSADQ